VVDGAVLNLEGFGQTKSAAVEAEGYRHFMDNVQEARNPQLP
jgi:hypothetical protein